MHIKSSINPMLIALLTVMVFVGCKKDQIIVVQGQVSEGYKKSALNQVQLRLEYSEISGGTFSSGFRYLDDTESDASGSFKFEFERAQVVNYRVVVEKQGFETAFYTVGGDEWASSEENEINVDLYELADLRIDWVNEFPKDLEDRGLIQLDPHSEDCSSCCPERSIAVTGSDSTIVCKVYANQTIQYGVTVINNEFVVYQEGQIDIRSDVENQIRIGF